MNITRLKTKNQVTLPKEIVDKLHLQQDELFEVDIEKNYIKLIPVILKPKYSKDDLKTIDKIVEKEKKKAKNIKSNSELSKYIKSI
ncbi:MAG: AbrB/MazE/SpoVT family DNA-binding domain-containing protein [Candidatus Aureabacteria bacterium]|nr:AbrB/MazE/SpoVT family DNA-binding domain-containing protein [Candidatus Auribacterota bacterium]